MNYDDISDEFVDFNVFKKCRTRCKHASGGVLALVKKHLYKCDNDFSLWLNVDENFFGVKTLIGIVYIPPMNSRFGNINMYDDIEAFILSEAVEETAVCIMGDFNARNTI